MKSPHAWTTRKMRHEALKLGLGHILYFNAHLSSVDELAQLDEIVFATRPDLVLQVSPGNNDRHDQAVIDALLSMRNLRALRISVRKKQDFSPLSGLQQLRSFGLITKKPVSIQFLEELTELEQLSFDGTPESLAPISHSVNLKRLFLQKVTIDSLEVIRALPKLAMIGVDVAIFRCAPGDLNIVPLRHLRLTNNRELADYSFLSRFTRLQSLELSSGQMTVMPDLHALPKLTYLVLNYLPKVTAIENIGTAPAIEKLELRDINPKLKAEQFQFLTRMPCLKQLCMEFIDHKKTRIPAIHAMLESAGLKHILAPGFLPHIFN